MVGWLKQRNRTESRRGFWLKRRRRNSSASRERAVMEMLEKRMLMSSTIQPVTNISQSYTFSDAYLAAGPLGEPMLRVDFSWTNHQPSSSVTRLSFEVKEQGPNSNFFTLQDLSPTTTSTYCNLVLDSSYTIRIRTHTAEGSAVSEDFQATTPTWTAFSTISVSATPAVNSTTYTTSLADGSITVYTRSTDNPFPQRWNYGVSHSYSAPYQVLWTSPFDYGASYWSAGSYVAHNYEMMAARGTEGLHSTGNMRTLTLSAPTNFSGTVTGNILSLSWSGSSPWYSVFADGVLGFSGATYTTTWEATLATPTAHSWDRSGYYAVGAGEWVQGIHPKSERTAFLDFSVAITPFWITAKQITSRSAVITWEDSAYNEKYYEVSRSDDGGANWHTLGKVSADTTSFVDFTVQPGQSYKYRVRALRENPALNSSYNAMTSAINIDVSSSPDTCNVCGASPSGNVSLRLPSFVSGAGMGFGEGTILVGAESGTFGNNANSASIPSLQEFTNGIVVFTQGTTRLVWQHSGSTFTATSGNTYSLTSSGTLYTVRSREGEEIRFNFDTQTKRGNFSSSADTAGNIISVVDSTHLRQTLAGGHFEDYYYTYANGRVQSVVMTRDGGAPVQTLQYTYYGAGDLNGNDGDIKTVTLISGNTTNGLTTTSYMRYYTPEEDNTNGQPGQLKYYVTGDSFNRMYAELGGSYTSTASSIAAFADLYYEYDSAGRVSKMTSAGDGCSICSGFGTSTYEYAINSAGGSNLNDWKYKKVEYGAGFDFNNSSNTANVLNITYSNFREQPLLTVTVQTATNTKWMEYFRYDTGGRQVLHAHPSAVTGYDDAYADLVRYSGSNAQYLADSSGLVEHTVYWDTTSAGTLTAGGALDYLKATAVSKGETGDKYYQSLSKYIKRTVNGVDFFFVAESTSFKDAVTNIDSFSTASALTTLTSYTWLGTTNHAASTTTTLPVVSASNNGPGTAASTTSVMDSYGRVIWTQDADGYLTYTEYHPTRGAIVLRIVDANPGLISSPPVAAPSRPGGLPAALHLKTVYEVDNLGRTTRIVDPLYASGTITSSTVSTYIVYDDANQATFTFPSATMALTGGNGTIVTTGPITVTRTGLPYSYTDAEGPHKGIYSETLTMSGTGSVTGGAILLPGYVSGKANLLNLNSASGQFTILSLSRQLYNGAGQLIESDAYSAINNSAYLATANQNPFTNTDGAQFYRVLYGYDMQGRQARTVNANQTITIRTFDALGRSLGTYIGTDDEPSSELDGVEGKNWADFIYAVNANPHASVAGTNMLLVSLNQYDNGGIGDGNLTQTTQFPTGLQDGSQRVTQYLFDWRNRMVSAKSGVQQSEGSDVQRPLTVSTLNNLGQVLVSSSYDGDGIAMTDSNRDGVPDSLDSSKLRARSAIEYDEQGRNFRTITYSVNPANGTFQTGPTYTIVSQSWFDKRGNTIASHTSGGPMYKSAFDGAGRLTASYVTDGGAVNNSGSIRTGWSFAASVTNDVVIEQQAFGYDKNGNTIETVTAQRFHTNSTSTGALMTVSINTGGDLTVTAAGGALAARLSYTATYYDDANRTTYVVNAGTNGGNAFSRQPNATENSGALITNYSYSAASQVAYVTDPKGIKQFNEYDALSRTIRTVANYVDGTPSNADDQTTLYTYDGANHVLTITADLPGTINQTTQYIYIVADAVSLAAGQGITLSPTIQSNDLLWLVKYPDKILGTAGASSSSWNVFNYNALGQTLTKRDQNGNTHTYGYDILGRLTSDSASMKPSVDVLIAQGMLADVNFEQVSVDPYNWVANPTGSAWTFTGDTGLTDFGDTNSAYLHEGWIYQSVTLVPGTYVFSFAAFATGSGLGQLVVSVDSTVVWSGDINATGIPAYYQTTPITLSAGAHTISFYGNVTGYGQGADNLFLDNVGIGMATSLVQDSSFEEYDLGSETEVYNPTTDDWTFIDNAGIALIDGRQAGFVNYGGSIQQEVYLPAGTYQIACDVNQGSSGLNLDIKVGTTTVGTFTGGAASWTTVVTETFTITTAGTYTLSFSDSSGAFGLDDVGVWTWKQTHSFGTLVASQRIATTFNTQGLVDTITTYDAASSGAVVNQVKRDYNGFGQMTREYQQHGAAVNTASSLAVVYAYNTSNLDKYGSRMVSMTYPSGKVLSYRYGSANGLNDLIGRLDNLAESGTVTLESYKYLGMGTVVERAMPQAGIKLTYIAQGSGDHSSDSGAYDPYVGLDRFGRVVDQRWRSTGGTPTDVDRYQYTYDANSNRLTKTNVLNSSFNETYTYDNLNRLTVTDRSGGSTSDQSWSLDALGNMSSVTTNGTAQNRTYNQQNQIVTMGAYSFAYDNNGNMTADDYGRTLVYDAWNRLVAVLDQYGILIKAYVYDGLNRRVTETDGWASTDLYYSAGWQVIEERKGITTPTGASASSNGFAAARYLFSPVYVNAPILRDRDADNDGSHTLEERVVFTCDANFNITAILNASGTVLERLAYESYGNFTVYDGSWTVQAGDTLSIRHNFQGGWQDLNTGLINFQMRDYNPRTYTWNTQDPLGFVDGMNRYAFVRGNPIINSDPEGLKVLDTAPSDFSPASYALRDLQDTLIDLIQRIQDSFQQGGGNVKWLQRRVDLVESEIMRRPSQFVYVRSNFQEQNTCLRRSGNALFGHRYIYRIDNMHDVTTGMLSSYGLTRPIANLYRTKELVKKLGKASILASDDELEAVMKTTELGQYNEIWNNCSHQASKAAIEAGLAYAEIVKVPIGHGPFMKDDIWYHLGTPTTTDAVLYPQGRWVVTPLSDPARR